MYPDGQGPASATNPPNSEPLEVGAGAGAVGAGAVNFFST
jgi:hypothetical protein